MTNAHLHLTERAVEIARIAQAAETFASLLSANSDMLGDAMASLRCTEADALCDLVEACGYPSSADRLREAHADADEPEDEHYPWLESDVRAGDLDEGMHFRNDAGGVSIVVTVDHEGDTVVVKHADLAGGPDVETSHFDTDQVLERLEHPAGKGGE